LRENVIIRVTAYLKAEIESAGREASHRSHHMSGDYAGFLKIGEYVETEAGENAATCSRNNDSSLYEIATSLRLPLHYLTMPDVDATSNYVYDAN